MRLDRGASGESKTKWRIVALSLLWILFEIELAAS